MARKEVADLLPRRAVVAAVVGAIGAGCGGRAPDATYAGAGPPPAPPADLPPAVHLESATEELTHEWWVALRAGRIWIRPNRETTGRDDPWRLLGPDGYPRHATRPLDGPPPRVVALSADGDNLAALGDDGLVYYMKFSDGGWIDDWGLPPGGDPLVVRFGPRALAMSHRGPLVGGYEDTDGNEHPVTAGVTTLYALGDGGAWLGYADPWLPAHFARRICLPERGRVRPVALSASASTLFVADAAGRLYTRLADYDTLGDNPILAYSWVREKRGYDEARTLPPEEWTAHAPPPGRYGARITILQTGKGNAGRELRVEGVAGVTGRGGYWKKALRGAAWTFVETGAPVTGPFLGDRTPPSSPLSSPPGYALAASGAVRLLGKVEAPGALAALAPDLEVALVGWDPVCPPATLRLSAARGAETLDVPLYWVAPDRDPADARLRTARGMLLLPRTERPPPALAPALAALFGDAARVPVDVAAGPSGTPVTLRGDAPGLFARLRLVFLE